MSVRQTTTGFGQDLVEQMLEHLKDRQGVPARVDRREV